MAECPVNSRTPNLLCIELFLYTTELRPLYVSPRNQLNKCLLMTHWILQSWSYYVLTWRDINTTPKEPKTEVQPRSVLGSFAAVLMSCKVNFYVVWSAFNVPSLYILADQVFFRSYVLRHIRLRPRLQFLSICWWHTAGGNHAIDGLASCPLGRRNTPKVASPNRTRWESSGLLRNAPVKVSQISVCSFFSYMYSPEDRRFRRFAM